jgi:hypothetical protein
MDRVALPALSLPICRCAKRFAGSKYAITVANVFRDGIYLCHGRLLSAPARDALTDGFNCGVLERMSAL